LHISLLGPLEIRRGQRAQELPSSKKARALLGYLIATGRSHRRDRLTELLWDIADDPRGGLRWCLSKIRPLVDDPQTSRIIADRECVEFQSREAQVDLFEIRDNLRHGLEALPLKKLEELAAQFRGTFLEGLELPDYDAFQAWLVGEREDARQKQAAILHAIVKELSPAPQNAVPYARRLVQIDPLDERLRAQLAGFLAQLGRHSEARQLIETGKRLARELGAKASGELARAERELLRPVKSVAPGTVVREVQPDAQSFSSAEEQRADWSAPSAIVGRDRELERMRQALENSRNRRQGYVLLITGEPGIGKSRLLAELSAHTVSLRGTVLAGRFYEAEARRAYGAWIDALRSLHPSVIGDVLRENLSPLLTEVPGSDFRDGTDDWRNGKDRLFASVVELLGARAHSAPPVLMQLDDVQWCDEASAELLHYVVRMTRYRPVAVVMTARSGELGDNEAIMRALRGFRRDRCLEEMELPPLSMDEISQLVGFVSPGANVQTVFDETAGNPLYAIELAQATDRSATLLDSTLRGLIGDRIARLPAAASDVLRWGAVLGTTFSLHRLAALASAGPDELMNALECLDRRGLLRESSPETGSATYAFTHNVVRRVVYDGLSEPRRKLMHWRVAQMLENDAKPIMLGAEVAHHAAQAGQLATAAKASVAAAQQCLRVYANGEALAFSRSGMRFAEALPESDRVGLQIELMEVSLAARRPKDIEETTARLEALAERALFLGLIEHARLGFHVLSYLRWEGGDWSGAKRHSLKAEFVSRGADTKEQVVAMAEAARCLALLERDLGQAEALALEARGRAANAGFEAVAIPDALGMLRFHQGAWDDAASFFDAAKELSLRQGDRTGEFQALEHLVVLELERGRPEAAVVLCRELIEIAAKLREGSEAPFARCLAALASADSGQEVVEQLENALESLRMADAKHRLAYALLRATHGDFRRREIEKARARGEEALRLAEILERPSEMVLAHATLLRCALLRSDRERAEHHREALRQVNLSHVAAHARKLAERTLAEARSMTWNS
jgi:predicted ATPase/DNA-binding SARP family transcriptional activator